MAAARARRPRSRKPRKATKKRAVTRATPKRTKRRTRQQKHLLPTGVMNSLGMFDAFRYKGMIPNPDTIGAFANVPMISRHAFSTAAEAVPTSNAKLLVVQWNPSASCAPTVMPTSEGKAQADFSHLTFTTLDENPPTSCRPQALSLRITNITTNDKIGGVIRVLRLNTPLDWEFDTNGANPEYLTATFNDKLRKMIESSADTRTVSNSELMKGMQVDLYPTSSVGYTKWYDYEKTFGGSNMGTISPPAIHAAYAQASSCAMGAIIVEFTGGTEKQDYTIELSQNLACRFPASSLLQNMQTNKIPRTTPARWQGTMTAASVMGAVSGLRLGNFM